MAPGGGRRASAAGGEELRQRWQLEHSLEMPRAMYLALLLAPGLEGVLLEGLVLEPVYPLLLLALDLPEGGAGGGGGEEAGPLLLEHALLLQLRGVI